MMKVGDLVRVIRDGKHNGHQNEVGKVYRILVVNDTLYPPYRLQPDGPYWCEEDDLQLINFNDYINQIQ